MVEKKSKDVSSQSFRLVRNLSAEKTFKSPFVKGDLEGFPTSGNDNYNKNELLNPEAKLQECFRLNIYGFNS